MPGAFIYTNPVFTRARRLFTKCISQPSIFCHQYWRFTELKTKFPQNRKKMSKNFTNFVSSQWGWFSQLSKNITNRNRDWTLLFVTYWRSASATAQQQKCCASNLEQGVGEVPAPSVLRQTKIWKDSRNSVLEKRWRDPRDDSRLMDKPAEQLPWFKRDWQDT